MIFTVPTTSQPPKTTAVIVMTAMKMRVAINVSNTAVPHTGVNWVDSSCPQKMQYWSVASG